MSILTSVKKLYADTAKAIPYHPSLNRIIQHVGATVFLQQVYFYASKRDFEPFYKFNEPCSHNLYSPGDSWLEELAMKPTELFGARDKVATKVTTGMKKSELRKVFIDGALAPLNRIILYWTDASRVTWYEFNEPLFLAHLAYAGSSDLASIQTDLIREYPHLAEYFGYSQSSGNLENPNYLETEEKQITFIPEKTTEKTTKNKKSPVLLTETTKPQAVGKKIDDFTPLELLVKNLNNTGSLDASKIQFLNAPIVVYDRSINDTITTTLEELYTNSESYRRWIDTTQVVYLQKFKHKIAERIAWDKIKAAISNMVFYQEWLVNNRSYIYSESRVVYDTSTIQFGQ